MTSDSELLAMQSSISTLSPILHEFQGRREQSQVFQSSEERSDNDMRNFEEHRSAQQGLGNKKKSVKIDNVKPSLEGENDDLFYIPIIQFVCNYI